MSRCQRLVVCALLVLLCGTSSATDAFSEGDQWLKWSEETRSAYVVAYLWGFEDGFFQGCQIGEEVYLAKPTGLPGEKCIAKIPNDLRTPEQYADVITAYYQSFPSDRRITIRRLLKGLQSNPNLTIQQMHEYYPSDTRK